jgi:hypothetical protein
MRLYHKKGGKISIFFNEQLLWEEPEKIQDVCSFEKVTMALKNKSKNLLH